MIKQMRSLIIFIFATLSLVPYSYADLIRDLVKIQGVRDNALVGYGIVVGLNGTGDQTAQTPFTVQSIVNMLSQLGITVPAGRMQLNNVAAVMVTAKLPPFSRTGQQVDVVVSSLANAKSLRGGTLIMTPLKGIDNQVYAIAQGNLFVGVAGGTGPAAAANNQLTGATIPNGATIERELTTVFNKLNVIQLNLNKPDFTQALLISDAINNLKKGSATAVDASTVALRMPMNSDERVRFLSQIQNINIKNSPVTAKVTINTRTGVIIMNQNVKLDNCAIAQGNLSVVVNNALTNNQPATITGTAPQAQTNTNQSVGYLNNIPTGADLNSIVNSLNLLGATPTELMSMLEALKTAGCLHASLETM